MSQTLGFYDKLLILDVKLEEKTFSLQACSRCVDREELNILTRLEFDTRKNMEPYNSLIYVLHFITCSKLPNSRYRQWRQNC